MGMTFFKYLIRAVIPYFLSAWGLLSAVLFVQQASRFSEILFDVNISIEIVLQLSAALVPNVISFTAPMALLVGTVIGLARLEESQEITAAMAAGVAPLGILMPLAAFGLVISVFALFVNTIGVPFSSALVRSAATQAAIKKLEDPIEPGVISRIAGLTVYVGEGDVDTGIWKKILILSDSNPDGRVRLITSGSGRLDVAGERSELVLLDALVTTFPLKDGEKFAVETAKEVRFSVQTGREALVRKLSDIETSPEEMGIFELSKIASEKDGPEKVEAMLVRQRRALLSAAPFIFSILGTFVALRVRGRGRGVGIAASLAVLVGFYLLTFMGEQMARTGSISVPAALAFPLGGVLAAAILLRSFPKIQIIESVRERFNRLGAASRPQKRPTFLDRVLDLSKGLRDVEITASVIKNYVISVIFLATIFLVFTAFELWKYAGAFEGGVAILLRYLVHVIPYVYLQISPIAALIAALATYSVKSGHREVVAWAVAGISAYRLIWPSALLMLCIGILNYFVADRLAPEMNVRQDQLRALLRSRGKPVEASEKDLSFVGQSAIYIKRSGIFTSDNVIANGQKLGFLAISLDQADCGGQLLFLSGGGEWSDGSVKLIPPIKRLTVSQNAITDAWETSQSFNEPRDPLRVWPNNPNHLSRQDIGEAAATMNDSSQKTAFVLASEKRIASIFMPLLFTLIAAGFVVSLYDKGRAVAIAKAVGLALAFMLFAGAAEQLGLAGSLPTKVAVWGPVAVLGLLVLALISRLRT